MSNIKAMLRDPHVGARNIKEGRNDDIHMDFLEFEVGVTLFRYIIPLPTRDDPRVIYRKVGNQYGTEQVRLERAEAERRYNQIVDEIYRAVELDVKAALVSASKGLMSIEEVLAADIVTANGMTTREMVMVQAEERRRSGNAQLPIRLPTLALPPPSSN